MASSSTESQKATNAANNIEFAASSGKLRSHTHLSHLASASLVTEGSGGNVLFIGALDASKTIATGDIFRINAGNLEIELK